jgi:transcription-repair coupling factor (superfamily II helicase)
MFIEPAGASPPNSDRGVTDGRSARHAPLGPTVARLCRALARSDVIAILSSEHRAEAVAAAAAALLPEALVVWLPPSDALPGENAPSSPAVAGKRFGALARLHERNGRPVLLVTEASAASSLFAPPGAFAAPALVIAPGELHDLEGLQAQLEGIGYFADDRVDEPGEMAFHGGTIDLYPADAEAPVRIHLDGDRIDRLAIYDPASQLGTGAELERLAVRPAIEPAPGSDAAPVFAHLPDALIALDPEAEDRRDRFLELASESRGKSPLLCVEHWNEALRGRERLDLAEGGEEQGRRFVQARNPERATLTAVKDAREAGDRILVTGSARDLRFFSRRMERILGEPLHQVVSWREIAAAPAGALLSAEVNLDRGWQEPGLTVLAAADALGARASQVTSAPSINPLLQEVADFHAGDAVIHEDHGLALLRGLETLAAGEIESDAIRLEYAAGAQRLVPAEEAHRLWRYGGEGEVVTLDRLEGSTWAKRRAEIDATIGETARQLIDLASERQAKTAPVLDPPTSSYERFAAGFPYAETPDQLRAIHAVRSDLASGRPMDRLVVGDVGYGKTEVALRAAAIAALAGKQVAIVVPTTILVRQHLETFTRRFARFGIKVAGLSRLSSTGEARAVKMGLADGSVQVVVGTQAVAGKAVAFQEIGLVIIDEEQRFGAATKRKLRELGRDAHVLTLTATPIPRTLQTALIGLQDLSLITTPPARRLPTRTSVAGFSPDLVRPALLREKRRGGQSFVVVPRIEDMRPMAERLLRLVPGLKLRQAHGKMPAAEIDEEMIRFSSGDGDILLATNIIEAGLDIPRANTMIIWRADRFGLAQLHQLRGRVGRGRARGYLLLLTEEGAEIAPTTARRLRTMEAMDQLGAGFAISARDLDLRGAGDLLGEEQAGHVKLIGLGLYQHLLEQALRTARGEHVDDWIPELHLGLGGRLSAEWIPEEEVRINLYARLARIASSGEMDALRDELEDRFGALPGDAVALLDLARLRLRARAAGVARVDAGPAAIALTPRAGSLPAAKAAGLMEKGGRYLLKEAIEDEAARLTRLSELLEQLGPAD